MFGWLKTKPKRPKVLYFNSNNAAFEYAVRYMQRPLLNDEIIIGQVIEPLRPRFGDLIEQQQTWRVRLATEHESIQTAHCGSIAEQVASDSGLKSSPIVGGDLVAVNVASYDPNFELQSPMQHFVIVCKLKPELWTDIHAFPPAGMPPATA